MKRGWRNALAIVAVTATTGAGALLAARQASAPPPNFGERGGFVTVVEVQSEAPSEPLVQGVVETLRSRIDPRGRHGVEFVVRGATIEVRVPTDDDLLPLREELARQQEQLASRGVPVERLAVVALRVDLDDPDAAREAETHIDPIARRYEVAPDDIRAFIRIAHDVAKQAHWTNSPADLSVGLSTMGVLELRIAAQAGDLAGAAPARVASPPEGYVWRPIRQLADWVAQPPGPERDALIAQLIDDPADHFTRLDRVARQHEGRAYLLLSDTPQASLKRGGGWRITDVYRFHDKWSGREELRFDLDGQGRKLILAMTGAHVGFGLGIVVDDEVIGAPRLVSAIGAGIIPGNFTERELRLLELALRHPLPAPIRIISAHAIPPGSPTMRPGSP